MNQHDFCYWLQGFAELGGTPTPEQWALIKEHLALVFVKVTPPLAPPAVSEPLRMGSPFDKANWPPQVTC